ncbi:hypothetical protein SAMN05421788_108129 [Filimonas lacunae]|uniref:Uncharacterized protein n=1 Tax=Filimonas lacunae TaxID=477680 RepID=A0A173MDT4_9BACT|nr:DUF6717 family protein [Filimonas lacunae]BAV05725.1 hypothetical protein FLA_1737 [Filimonas lacunae]SIT28785.1 hypothetical protein SAMN05421788_108129 [Filimonas lacunae]
MKQEFRFYKTPENRWYIDLPEWTESISALEMVEGADTMLDKASNNTNECFLELGLEPFENADVVVLAESLQDSVGGGYYFMETYKGEKIDHTMWLCEVTEFVFGHLPEKIYIGYK